MDQKRRPPNGTAASPASAGGLQGNIIYVDVLIYGAAAEPDIRVLPSMCGQVYRVLRVPPLFDPLSAFEQHIVKVEGFSVPEDGESHR